jgi:hypothetical protein
MAARRLRVGRLGDASLALAFCAAVTAPLVACLTTAPPKVLAEENRRPALPPKWRPLQRIPRKFDAYYRDRFGFRAELVGLHNVVKVLGLGVSTHPKVVIGKDGWLFLDDEQSFEDYRGRRPFLENELERWCMLMERRRDWLARRGCAVLFVVAPNKESVYPEFVPEERGPRGRTRLDQLLDHLRRRSDVAVLDLRPALTAARGTEAGPLYLRRDTHWNDRGAFAAYRAICGGLARDFPGLTPWPREGFEDRELPRSPEPTSPDLSRMLHLESWLPQAFPSLQPRRPRRAAAAPAPRPDRFQPAATRTAAFTVADASLPRLAFFGDSFGWSLQPFLAEHFRRSVFVYHTGAPDRALIEEERPDLVIHEVCERFLGRALEGERDVWSDGADDAD